MHTTPNILWFCTDQQRFDTIRALGNPHIRTPNLDRLVREGVTFTRAYSQSPVCSPSRACFLTGRYPRTTRCRQNGMDVFPADEVLVTKILADAGYDCGLVGKLHLAGAQGRVEPRTDDGYRVFHWSHHPEPDWPENAYTQWHEAKGRKWEDMYRKGRHSINQGVPVEYHQSTWCAEKTIEHLSENRDGPWLMSVNPFDPHHAFDPPPEMLARMDIDAMPLPKFRPECLPSKPSFQQTDHRGAYGGKGASIRNMTEDEQRLMVASYYAMIELLDEQFGRILDALERTGQREDTLILFHSDHGEMLGDHGIVMKGPHFYDCAVRVPLIVSWPGHFEEGLQSDALVELTDLPQTLLDAAGLPHHPGMQGKSLFPICTGAADPDHHREHVYCEYYNAMPGHGGAYGTMLRDERYKVVVYHGTDEGELYDLHEDPDEFVNLWASQEHANLRCRMIKRCFDASVFTMDPLPSRITRF